VDLGALVNGAGAEVDLVRARPNRQPQHGRRHSPDFGTGDLSFRHAIGRYQISSTVSSWLRPLNPTPTRVEASEFYVSIRQTQSR
jgi:hypothetical protein